METECMTVLTHLSVLPFDWMAGPDMKKQTKLATILISPPLSLPSIDQTAWLDMKKGIVFAMGEDVFTENPRVSVHHSFSRGRGNAWILTIKDVTEADAGVYMCSLNTPGKLRKLYTLTVVGECWLSVRDSVLHGRNEGSVVLSFSRFCCLYCDYY